MRTLEVYIDRHRVGMLAEGDDLWRFEYDDDWIAYPQAFDLAPALPRAARVHADGATRRPVQWYFDNLLPEEALREALARDARVSEEDAFALLEYLGAESAGALTLLPPGTAPAADATLRELPDAELQARIEALPTRPLSAGAPKRTSVAGAQHKLLVVLRDGRLYEPVGATASTHILKPPHLLPEYPASVLNEYVTMRLAAAVGLDVPHVTLRRVPTPVYVVERFDRIVTRTADGPLGIDVQRKHAIDACQLLNRSRVFKHTGATLESLVEVIDTTTNRADTRLRLFRWLAFNVVVGNDDCHLKNLSFHVAADGVRLAPHYDLLSTATYATRTFAGDRAEWPARALAIPLPGARTFGEITRAALMDAAAVLGVPARPAARILKTVTDRLPAALARERAALAQMHDALSPETRAARASEARWLDVFENIVLREMLATLS